MNRSMIVGAICALGLIATSTVASAQTFTFPGSSSTWSSATNGSGSGLSSFSMWTSGDYISAAVNAPGLVSASQLSYSFSVVDYLGSGTETLNILVNGTTVDTQAVLGCGYCGTESVFSNAVSFAPITGNGNYSLEIQLTNTIGSGDGSIYFDTPGSFTLSAGSPVPEPASLALISVGLAGLGLARRRNRG
jgi:hypothetical protein